MNRIKISVLASLLTATLLAVSACGSVCNHMDNDGNKLCDLCGASLVETAAESESASSSTPTGTTPETEAAKYITTEITVKDQYGTPIAGAVFQINDDANQPVKTVTTSAEGVVNETLPEGSYTAVFTELPEYHLGGTVQFEIKEGDGTVALEVINNTPDGTEAHPFFLNSEAATFTFEANATIHFTMFAGDRRSIVIENAADITLTLEGTTHMPDENGLIKVPVVADNQQNHLSLSVTSKTAGSVTIGIVSDLGSSDNPIVIEELGTVTAIVPKDRIIYYSFTAKEGQTGIYLRSDDPTNNISMTNRTTSVTTNFTNGSVEEVGLDVKTGDIIVIAVSILGGDQSLDSYTLTFTLTGAKG